MARTRAQDSVIDTLEDALGEIARMNTRPSQDILDMYGKKGNGSSANETQITESLPQLPSASTLASGENLSIEAAKLVEADQQHTKAMCSLVRGQLDGLKRMITELETELDDMEQRRHAAGSALIESAHKILTVVPDVKLQLNHLGTAVRASGA